MYIHFHKYALYLPLLKGISKSAANKLCVIMLPSLDNAYQGVWRGQVKRASLLIFIIMKIKIESSTREECDEKHKQLLHNARTFCNTRKR